MLSVFTLVFVLCSELPVLSFVFLAWDTMEVSTAKLTTCVTVCTIYVMKP